MFSVWLIRRSRSNAFGGSSGTGTQDTDGLVDDRAGRQCGLQLRGQRPGLVEHVRVVHRHGGGNSEPFPELGGAFGEGVLTVRVDVDGTDHLAGKQQR